MKKLITKKNIDEYLVEGENKFYADSSMIISPGAKDILRNKGIVIIYGDRKESCGKDIYECKEVSCLDAEKKNDRYLNIASTIARLLTQEFRITDAEMVEEITSKVLNKIEE
ncbi:hypothetical protein [Paramaledivibacter caminithermalis]|uniref:Uncharacterized protein n=1 Tax=Paramaledivibacter caminithermalis (strain DSM 15212 / CIP 107654 / DViRD3) TaxID=1121301 RepID=A0A1M6PN49_PARC5|nr:hypothetical protein [Paramaledivibacter caminithermalis]SHK09386.1 hypothetical protein SAMN02745912_02228 [Paramaledivibacter caminithermalis DSM 15212]